MTSIKQTVLKASRLPTAEVTEKYKPRGHNKGRPILQVDCPCGKYGEVVIQEMESNNPGYPPYQNINALCLTCFKQQGHIAENFTTITEKEEWLYETIKDKLESDHKEIKKRLFPDDWADTGLWE